MQQQTEAKGASTKTEMFSHFCFSSEAKILAND